MLLLILIAGRAIFVYLIVWECLGVKDMAFVIALCLVIGISSGGVCIYEFLRRRNVPGTIYGIVAAGLILAAIFISIFPSTSGTSGGHQPGNTPTPTLALQQGTTVTPETVQTTPTIIPSPTPSPTPTV